MTEHMKIPENKVTDQDKVTDDLRTNTRFIRLRLQKQIGMEMAVLSRARKCNLREQSMNSHRLPRLTMSRKKMKITRTEPTEAMINARNE